MKIKKEGIWIFFFDTIHSLLGEFVLDEFLKKLPGEHFNLFYFFPPYGMKNSDSMTSNIQYDHDSCHWIVFKILLDLSKIDYFETFREPRMETFNQLPESLSVMLKSVQKIDKKYLEQVIFYRDLVDDLSGIKLFKESVQPVVPLPNVDSVSEAFEFRVKECPENIAIVYQKTYLTYEALNKQANQLAHYIIHTLQNHTDKHTKIAIHLHSKLNVSIAILAILKIGAAYVPLDPEYPEERLQYMLADSEAQLMITDTEMSTSVASEGFPIIHLAKSKNEIQNESEENLSMDSANRCYILYTSGSTGTPKGVEVTHNGVLNNISNYLTDLEITSQDKILNIASYSHDQFVVDFFAALLSGATSNLLPTRVDLNKVAKFVSDHEITVFSSIPKVFRVVFEMAEDLDFPNLRVITIGGDTVNHKDVNLYKTLCAPKCALYPGYGATEISWALWYKITQDTPIDNDLPIPLGQPTQDVQVILLNRDQNNAGEVGLFAPKSLANGYYHNQELTKQAFIAIPEYPRIYRTGDIAQEIDGTYYFMGRANDHVKIRGQRVNLQEIENQCCLISGVDGCAVIFFEEKLLAYVTLKQGVDSIDHDFIFGQLKAFLPSYMVPHLLLQLNELPLLPNGKKDKKALIDALENQKKTQEINQSKQKGELTTEQRIKKIAQRYLGCKDILPNQNLYELGLDSIKIFRVSNALNNEFNTDTFTLPAIHQNPTISSLVTLYEDGFAEQIFQDNLYDKLTYPIGKGSMTLFKHFERYTNDRGENEFIIEKKDQYKLEVNEEKLPLSRVLPRNYTELKHLTAQNVLASFLFCPLFEKENDRNYKNIDVISCLEELFNDENFPKFKKEVIFQVLISESVAYDIPGTLLVKLLFLCFSASYQLNDFFHSMLEVGCLDSTALTMLHQEGDGMIDFVGELFPYVIEDNAQVFALCLKSGVIDLDKKVEPFDYFPVKTKVQPNDGFMYGGTIRNLIIQNEENLPEVAKIYHEYEETLVRDRDLLAELKTIPLSFGLGRNY